MADQGGNDSFNLKHRLTGAGVLIAFAVVVLPLLLGGPPDEPGAGQSAGQDPRDADTQVFRSSITPIGGDTPGEQSAAGTQAPQTDPGREVAAVDAGGADTGAQASAPAQPAPEAADPEPVATGDAADNADTADTAAVDSDAAGAQPEEVAPAQAEQKLERGWIVQVGTFAQADNVRKLSQALEGGGFEPSTTEVQTSQGPMTRVWVGPFETRVQAARVKTRVKQRNGIEGLIVAYP